MGAGFVKRPHWGGYRTLHEGDGYVVKLLAFEDGAIRNQRHAHRDEYWICVSGRIAGYINNERFEIEPGDSLYIQAGDWHQFGGRGEVVEIWMGDKLSEDDIETDDPRDLSDATG